MQTIVMSSDETSRLDELRAYNILDTLTEKEYDDITYMASLICNAPISLISFVDQDRQWFKSYLGLASRETAREYSFCSRALLKPGQAMIVPDARKDERFMANPLVTGEPNIVFYAGVPLVNEKGFGLGTVCVIDKKPRELSAEQLKGLEILAAQVMRLLELRKNAEDTQLAKLQLEIRNKDLEQFAMIVAHDIKSPLTSIVLSNQLVTSNYANVLGSEGMSVVAASIRSADKIKTMVDNILSYYKDGAGSTEYETLNFAELLDSVTATIISPKQYKVSYTHSAATVRMNRTQLEQIFFNLINNSIRYNEKPVARITVRLTEDKDHYHFTVTDNGIGIATEKQDKIFNLFTTAATTDVFGIKGHGIGLPSVKKIIESYQGSLSISSEVGMGTVIAFTIKKPA